MDGNLQYAENGVKFKRLTKRQKKCTSANERFHASGGADSYDTEQVTSSFALVRALPMPPPA